MRAQIAELEENPRFRLTFMPRGGRADLRRQELTTTLAEEMRPTHELFNPSIGSIGTARTHVSYHEREWIQTYLGAFYHDGLITDVLRRVKGGKEATVYCCRAHHHTGLELAAGKVYHEQKFRSLKNDALYREGRMVRDEKGRSAKGRREKLAVVKKTRFGQDLRHTSWLSNEYGVLETLHNAGADVPRPIAQSENAILMEYVGDELWPAPILHQVKLSSTDAASHFRRVMWNIDLMLAHEIIHADLSAHNILYQEGTITIIDFPQAVSPYVNPHAYDLLLRDVERICQYFARFGVGSDPTRIVKGLWTRHMPS
jgi:RIO kinase 1